MWLISLAVALPAVCVCVCACALQGELALAFGDLLRRLWSPSQEAVAPRQFKGVLSRFAPQFSGYNQHDSQVSTTR